MQDSKTGLGPASFSALPGFHPEATAALAELPDDELPDGVSRHALLAQLDALTFTRSCDCKRRCGAFRVSAAGRLGDHDYAFFLPFYVPSGSVIADLDRSLQLIGFEPISVAAIHDLQAQLDSVE